MKTFALLGLLAFTSCVQVGAHASQPKRIKASIDCGSFQLNSVTDEIKVPDEITRATFQAIRLVNRSRHIDTHLDLKQHISQDSSLGGLLDIDGVATRWRCIRAPSGAHFVFVGFVCVKEEVKSCSASMGSPSADWLQIFDSEGNALFRRPPETFVPEEELMKKLGVYDAFYGPIDFRSHSDIYDEE